MSLSPDLPDTEIHFTNAASGAVDADFALGGESTLTIVVNNVVRDRGVLPVNVPL